MVRNKSANIKGKFSGKNFQDISNVARRRLIDMHYRAGVGHIGGNLSALDVMLYLYHKVMKENDVFVLSKGHAAGALYVTLWTLGYLSDDDLDNFHGEGSLLPGHPAPNGAKQITLATGSLGHGFPVACGIALSRKVAKKPGKIFCLCSDGEWQAGSNWEALIFGTHHQLDNLSVLIDNNGLQGFGRTVDITSMNTFKQIFQGFDVVVNELDGHSAKSLAKLAARSKQSLTVFDLHTIKGKGISFMENKLEWHYLPLTEEQYARAIAEL